MSSNFKDSAGFSLIEFIVSIGIVLVILSIVVSNQSTYTDGIALSNLADEISSTISQAQTYGVGVRELTPGIFSAAYGLTFSLRSFPSGSNKDYIYFADKIPKNGIYDGDWSCPTGDSSECLLKTPILQNNIISDICVVRSVGADQCSVGRVDVSFTRPTPEPRLLFFNQGGESLNLPNTIGARIELRSPAGAERSVTVYNTGQITAQ